MSGAISEALAEERDNAEPASRVRWFFEHYLNLDDTGLRPHVTLVLHDRPLPAWFTAGLRACRDTRVELVDVSGRPDHLAIAQAHAAVGAYVSIHDYVENFTVPVRSARRLAMTYEACDYTSLELPRYGTSTEQLDELLLRYVHGDPAAQRASADEFFTALARRQPYEVRVVTGREGEHTLTVSGDGSWVELGGQLVPRDIRFAPGCELFFHGPDVNGELYCDAGVNLLPFRGSTGERDLCDEILALGKQLPTDPIVLRIERGLVADARSTRRAATTLHDLINRHPAFGEVVEVGFGLNPGCLPVIMDWAAASNEAVPGVHVGVGADPTAPSRCSTAVHFDFLAVDCAITVNGTTWAPGRPGMQR